jgi:hypothetical protein
MQFSKVRIVCAMEAEGRKQKAESRRQKAESMNVRRREVLCLIFF